MAYFYNKTLVSDLLALDTFFASDDVFSRNYYLNSVVLPAVNYVAPVQPSEGASLSSADSEGETDGTDAGSADAENPVHAPPGPLFANINGTAGDDVINGTSSADVIHGLGGNDIINGLGTADQIFGDAGNDTMILVNGQGSDDFDGGTGIDTLDFSGFTTGVTFDLAAGTYSFGDAISIENVIAGSANDTIIGTSGANDLQGRGGNDTISGGNGDDIIDGGDGNDLLEGGLNADTITGGDGNDTIFAMTQANPNGSTVGDILRGGDGDDIITGSGGDDTIFVGDGADTADGGDGDDIFDMSDGFDTGNVNDLDGGTDTDLFLLGTAYNSDYSINLTTGEWRQSNNNLLATLTNIENVTGGNGDDLIVGNNTSTNVLNGGNGNDTLLSIGGNNNVLNGGAGDDRLGFRDSDNGIFGSFSSGNTFDGGGGTDVLDFHDFGQGYIANLAMGVFSTTAGLSVSTLVDIENVFGGDGDDQITGSVGDNVLSGGAGADTLDGGAGIDTLDYSDSDAAVTVALGAPSASGGHADGDVISNFENVTGSNFDDSLTGNGLSNTLIGGLGNDTLIIGGANADSALGGAGDDLLRISSFSSTNDAHIFDGGSDTDTFSFATFGGDYEVNLNSGTFNNLAGTGNASSLISIENVEAGGGDDTITGTIGDNVINGNGGNDTIIDTQGTGDNDIFDGGSGIDIFRSEVNWSAAIVFDFTTGEQRTGATVHDTFLNFENISVGGRADVIGNAGDNVITVVNTSPTFNFNTIDGGAGNDTIDASNGNDIVTGGAGADTMDGGTGRDTLDYTGSGAAVQIDLGLNTAAGGDAAGDVIMGFESVDGSTFNDTLTSGFMFGVLNGFDGNDILAVTGGLQGSTLNGGNGNDILTSAVTMDGSDLNGGAGNDDITVFNDSALMAADFADGGTGNDVVRIGLNDILGLDLNGGADIDTLSLIGLSDGYTVDLGAGTLVNNFTTDAAAQAVNFENATGGNGADTITGTNGNNILIGGLGIDVLNGGDGNDILYGDLTTNSSGFSDTINGGAGDDIIIYARTSSSGSDVDSNDGGAGIDTFIMSNITGSRLVDLTAGNWTTGNITAPGSIRGTLTNIENVLIQGDGDIDVRGDVLDNTITFTSLTASNEAEGMAGNDTINTGGGDDRVEGGAGADIMNGGDGIDILDYAGSAAGVTVNMLLGTGVNGDAAGDTFSNFENLFGSQSHDILTGDTGANLISGADGNDRIDGGDGDDVLQGDNGADTIFGGAGADNNDGGAGFDSMDFRGSTSRVVLDVALGGTIGDAAGDTYSGFERYYLSNFNDSITGTAANEFFYGEDGNDTINAGDGIDRVYGGDGNDIQRGQGGNDLLYGSAGADQLNGGIGFDIASYDNATSFVSVNLASGGAFGDALGDTYFGIEAVYGSDFNDILIGNNSTNELRGGDGDDTLSGSGGNDRLFGGAGADSMNGGAGVDIAMYSDATARVEVDLQTGGTVGDAAGDTYVAIEWIVGSDFNDELFADDGNNRIEGGGGADFIIGRGGNDRILAGDGNDLVNGGAGVDTIFGQAGDDTMFGGADNDFFIAGDGADAMDGENGFDTVNYLVSTSGVDVNMITGGFGGDATGDTYVSIERIFGSQHNDSIEGSNNDDTLFGFGGNDYIEGLQGNDSLIGGAGTDNFGYNTVNGAADVINDFNSVGEVIFIRGGDPAFNTFAEVIAVATDVGANVLFNFGGGNTLTLLGKNIADLDAGDFDFSVPAEDPTLDKNSNAQEQIADFLAQAPDGDALVADNSDSMVDADVNDTASDLYDFG